MHAQAVAQTDCPPAVTSPVQPLASWRVRSVRQTGPLALEVQFNDGLTGRVDMQPLVTSVQAGVFAALANPSLFAKVFVELGAVAWPGGLDLAPDAMYDDIKSAGVCVPS